MKRERVEGGGRENGPRLYLPTLSPPLALRARAQRSAGHPQLVLASSAPSAQPLSDRCPHVQQAQRFALLVAATARVLVLRLYGRVTPSREPERRELRTSPTDWAQRSVRPRPTPSRSGLDRGSRSAAHSTRSASWEDVLHSTYSASCSISLSAAGSLALQP